MRLLHLHFGKDGGAERFFVKLACALDRRGVEQTAFIRPGRAWRAELPPAMEVVEGVPRVLTRPWLAWRRDRLAADGCFDGMIAWMWRAADFLPPRASGLRVARLGDYPREIRSLRHADVVVCNTPGIVGRLRSLGWERRVEVISNFTDVRLTKPADRAAHGIPPDAFLVVAAGRLVELKGYPVMLRALAKVPDAHLWIVGDGEERGPLTRLADELCLSCRVHFLGWQPDPAPFLAAADVVCLTSRHETLGNVVLEGWAASKPVVSTRAAGPSWLIRDGENGLLVDIADDAALADALCRLRDSPAEAARLGLAGRRELESRFSETAICEAYTALFQSRS